jgi:hypothetical protein
MSKVQVFRPKGNLGWAAFAAVLDIMFLVQAIAYPGAGSVLALDLAVAVTLGVVAYLLWVRPKLVLRETDLVVVNPTRRVVIAYRDITELETKWALLVHHTGGKTRVFVAPANGKQRWVGDSVQRWSFGKFLQQEKTQSEFTSISQSTSSDSGIAYQLIRERIKDLH